MKSTIRQTVHKMTGLGVVAKAVLGAALVLGGATAVAATGAMASDNGTSPVSTSTTTRRHADRDADSH